jgi:hypothetical protein
LTEPLSLRLSKSEYDMLMKLVEAKGSNIAILVREAVHLLFALHGMLPEETSRLLLGQFIQDPRILQMVKARSGAQ